jgi:hypothetical protein
VTDCGMSLAILAIRPVAPSSSRTAPVINAATAVAPGAPGGQLPGQQHRADRRHGRVVETAGATKDTPKPNSTPAGARRPPSWRYDVRDECDRGRRKRCGARPRMTNRLMLSPGGSGVDLLPIRNALKSSGRIDGCVARLCPPARSYPAATSRQVLYRISDRHSNMADTTAAPARGNATGAHSTRPSSCPPRPAEPARPSPNPNARPSLARSGHRVMLVQPTKSSSADRRGPGGRGCTRAHRHLRPRPRRRARGPLQPDVVGAIMSHLRALSPRGGEVLLMTHAAHQRLRS